MLRIFIFAVGALALGGCSDACTNTVVSRIDAPGGEHSAVMFQRDCGATSGFSTQVSVLEDGDEPSGGGNTYRADDDHGAAELGNWGGPWAEITWLTPNHLLVRYAAGSRIFEQDEEVAGVNVSYEPVNR
jgi:hypothetical protein